MEKITPIRQRDDSSCGPASIAMIARFFGRKESMTEIERLTGYKKGKGVWNADIVAALRALGLTAREKSNVTWAQLQKTANKPNTAVLVCWMHRGLVGHYSVVEEVTDDTIRLADPYEGAIVEMDKGSFLCLWMDYENMAYPKKNTDIQLRWMVVVTKR
jgi:ABC-type bacteriocin/lantibiotic exporter with double-glycine peptidase domain